MQRWILIGFQWWPATLWSGYRCNQQTGSARKWRMEVTDHKTIKYIDYSLDFCHFPSYLQDCQQSKSELIVNGYNHWGLEGQTSFSNSPILYLCQEELNTCPSADHAREVHCGGSALLFVLITSCLSSSTMIFPSRSCTHRINIYRMTKTTQNNRQCTEMTEAN